MLGAVDWAATPLGPVCEWSHALRTMVGLLLRNRFPLLLWWGPKFVQIYNDAYAPIPGDKHPRALGQPGEECWSEIWDIIGPMVEAPFRGEPATWSDDLPLMIHRRGFLEETHFKVAYSPVPDESVRSGIGGVLATVAETTEEVFARRQLTALRHLAGQVSAATTPEEACAMAARTLEAHPKDIPCALFYLLDADGKSARLVSRAGFGSDSLLGTPPPTLCVDDGALGWPIGQALRERRVLLSDVGPVPPPLGASEYVPNQTVILPLASPDQALAYGVAVLFASPHRTLDQRFFELAAEHVVSAMRNARAYQHERERAEKLAELDRAKTRFFSNISHEFRTPLTLMLAPLDDLRTELGASRGGENRERIDLLHRNAQRLLKLVNTLLDFSRIEAGRAEALYQPTDLAALTADLASSFRSVLEQAGLALVVDCPPLPEEVHVDRDMWEKIVLNLLSNAFKFTFEGTVAVRLRADAEAVELSIADTGIGVSEDDLPRLFERFHRVEGARSRSFEGSGIGLAFVQELVRLHGGEISVESRLGEGTTFYVRLPRGTARSPRQRREAPGPDRERASSRGAFVAEALRWVSPLRKSTPPLGMARASATGSPHERVLVADDNADMREYLSRLLRERWDVDSVADGETALEAIRRHPPDLVLADVMMPGLDGFGLLRALRVDAITREVPVVLVSARAGDEATAEALRAGADDYLVKPFTARELFARLTARLASVQAARAQREQRTNLYRALMQAPFAVVIVRGPDRVLELANDIALKIWGKGPEIVGLPLLDGVPEMRGQPLAALLDDVRRTGTASERRGERVRLPVGPAGELQDIYLSYVYAPLFDARNEVEAVMVAAFDVTEQVRSREALRVTSQRLEAAQSVAGIGIFDWDLHALDLYWSPELYVLMGLPPGAIEPDIDAWNDSLVEEDRARGWRDFRQATAAGHTRLEQEQRLRLPNGTTRWLRITQRIFYDEQGSPSRVLGAAVDIEALKQAASARDRERRRLLTMLEQVPASVNFLRGRDLVFEFAHPLAIRSVGGRELLGKPLLEAMPEHRDQPFYQHLRRVYETGEPFVQHEALARFVVDGKEVARHWDSVYMPVRDDAGNVEGVMTFDLEVTESVLARRALEDADRAKDEFLATMSHELRTPLNAVLGWATILLRDHSDPAKLERGLAVIERNARAQARLVGDLLDVSRIVSGKLGLTLKRVELAAVIHAAAEVVRPAADARRVRLVLDLEPDLGEMIADPDRLQQIVWNLLSNAVRFTPSEGHVTVTAKRLGSVVTMRVDDTGAGIAAEHLPHIFERFRQVDSSATRSHGGLGLGLAIVRHLVDAHGGRVDASSPGLGRGSTFTVTLPVRAVIASERHAAVPESDPAVGLQGDSATGAVALLAAPLPPDRTLPLRTVCALVVEDDADSLDLIRVVLEEAGARVVGVPNAQAALAERGPFDVIISDIGMSEMDGYALMRALRARAATARVPGIALTAYARSEDAERALAAGYQQHVSKPVDSGDLIAAVQRLIG